MKLCSSRSSRQQHVLRLYVRRTEPTALIARKKMTRLLLRVRSNMSPVPAKFSGKLSG